MIKHVIETEIRRRPADVFSYLADVTKMTEWEPNTLRCQPIGDQALGRGSKAVQTFKMFGRQSDVTLTVVDYKLNHRLRFQKNEPFPISFGWTLKTAREGTHVVYSAVLEPKGIFRLMALFMKSRILKQIENDLASIKRNLEANAG